MLQLQLNRGTARSRSGRRAPDGSNRRCCATLLRLRERRRYLKLASAIVQEHLPLLGKRDLRELMRLTGATAEQVEAALEVIRALDPRPGQRYNQPDIRLIEPDVAFAKRGDVWVVVMNEEDLPALRLNAGYRRMLRQKHRARSEGIRQGALSIGHPAASKH